MSDVTIQRSKDDLTPEEVHYIQNEFRMHPWISTVDKMALQYGLEKQEVVDVINMNTENGVVLVKGGVFTKRHRRQLYYCLYETSCLNYNEIQERFGMYGKEFSNMIEMAAEEKFGKEENDKINQRIIELYKKGLGRGVICKEIRQSERFVRDKITYLIQSGLISREEHVKKTKEIKKGNEVEETCKEETCVENTVEEIAENKENNIAESVNMEENKTVVEETVTVESKKFSIDDVVSAINDMMKKCNVNNFKCVVTIEGKNIIVRAVSDNLEVRFSNKVA